jgi:hypothetical protein
MNDVPEIWGKMLDDIEPGEVTWKRNVRELLLQEILQHKNTEHFFGNGYKQIGHRAPLLTERPGVFRPTEAELEGGSTAVRRFNAWDNMIRKNLKKPPLPTPPDTPDKSILPSTLPENAVRNKETTGQSSNSNAAKILTISEMKDIVSGRKPQKLWIPPYLRSEAPQPRLDNRSSAPMLPPIGSFFPASQRQKPAPPATKKRKQNEDDMDRDKESDSDKDMIGSTAKKVKISRNTHNSDTHEPR